VRKKLLFIVGPTASGKTDIALALAKTLKTEIISCDAMQVYKEVSILTAKPSTQALKKIKHHLVGNVSIKENFDVFTFRKKVLKAIAEIEKKRKIPLIVGGSGLYMSILLDGIFEEKDQGRNLKVRKKIEQEIHDKGREAVYQRLKEVDPAAAAKIHVNDTRRVVRALEVFEVYGKPMSLLRPKREGLWSKYDVSVFVVSMKRDDLYERINARVDKMFESGAVEEVKRLKRKKISQTASGIIGLKEIRMFLDDKISEDEAKELIKRNTRHYAKRQLTWFRKDKRLTWVEIMPGESSEKIVKQLFKLSPIREKKSNRQTPMAS
jgi:tRNA dimethylallyltransferase